MSVLAMPATRFLPHRRSEGVLLAGVLLVIYLTLSLTLNLSHRINDLRESQDNVQWNLAQLEVDYLKLHAATKEAIWSGDTELAQVRKRFDIFYSRIYLIENSGNLRDLHSDKNLHEAHEVLKAFLRDLTPLLDTPGTPAASILQSMQSGLEEIAPLPRSFALSVVGRTTALTGAERTRVLRLFQAIGLISIVIAAALIAGFVILVAQRRALAGRKVQLAAASARTLSILRASLDAVLVIDSAGIITEFNGSAEKIFGHGKATMLGSHIGDIIVSPDFMSEFQRSIGSNGPDGGPDAGGRLEFTGLRRNGEEFPVEVSISASNPDSDEGFSIVTYIRDITDEMKTRKALHAARDEALSAYEQKSNFFAVMSHEMRTPLNGIMSALDLIHDTALTPDQARLIGIAQTSSEILLHHANDVLAIERIEACTDPVIQEAVHLPEMVSSLVAGLTPLADKQGTGLHVELEGQTDLHLMLDRRAMQQVMLNLLGNAVKFTSGGDVTARIQVDAHDDGTAILAIDVVDSGIGITPEDQKRVFDDFVTLDPTYERNATGTGLGLGIARRQVERMGGALLCVSDPGHGSTFSFELETTVAADSLTPQDGAPPQVEPAARPRCRDLSILIVEDNDINRELLGKMLEAAGHRITATANAVDGICAANETRFDLILMDISMPDINGMKATEAIRASDGASSRAPVYAVTAHALPEERARFRAAGMDGCLTKPVRRPVLLDLLETIPKTEAGAPPRPERPLLDLEQLGNLEDVLTDGRMETMLTIFREEVTELLARLPEEATLRNLRDLQKRVHQISGSAAIFGAAQLHQHLNQIETACKAGHSDTVRQLARDLPALWMQTSSAISERVDAQDAGQPEGKLSA